MFNKGRWYQDSFTAWNKLIADFKGLKIAIARKAPRMFEYQVQRGNLPKDILDSVVSEHALPFLLTDDRPVSVIDDAIYYGTTFENVLTFIRTTHFFMGKAPLSKDTLKAFPVIRAKDSKMFADIDLNHVPIADNKNIPYYIERLATEFISLGKPFDVEFPIIYLYRKTIEEESKIGYKEFCDEVYSILMKVFPECKVYPIEHITNDDVVYNCSVIFSPSLHSGASNTEFAKFRFFVSKDRICLTAYSPSILNEDILTEVSPLFKDTIFEELWKKAYVKPISEIKEPTNYSYIDYLNHNHRVEQINKFQWAYQLDESEYIRKRSLIILANYLHSYSLVLEKKTEIETFAELLGYQIKGLEVFDLQLLLGQNLAPVFANKLNEIFISYQSGNDKLPIKFIPDDDFLEYFSENVIPEEYEKEYNWENEKDWYGCESLPEALSAMFSNMHIYIEKASRGNFPDDVRRLRFGGSYDSIYQELCSKIDMSSINIDLFNIHKWIDKKIDEGSVVPKYDRIQYYNKFFWHRLFRSGENEDRFAGQLIRIFVFIFENIQSQFEEDYIERDLMENIFSVLFSDNNFKNITNKKTLGKIKWNEPLWKDTCYKVSFYNEFDSSSTFLFDYLYRMQIFREVENYSQCIKLSNTPIVSEYRKGTTLDDEIESEILSSISILVTLLKYEPFENRIGIINRLMYADRYTDYELLDRIKNVQLKFFFEKVDRNFTLDLKDDLEFNNMKESLDHLFLCSYTVTSEYIKYKVNDQFIFLHLPEDESKEYLYQRNLYLIYKVSEMIQAYTLFNDKKYIVNIINRIKEEYSGLSSILQKISDIDNYEYFFTTMEQIVYGHENSNQRSFNQIN
jgi:hypothetical protein